MSSHSDDHSSSVSPDSTYPPLEAPAQFHSQIPEHLLIDASPTERYIMEQTNVLRQYMDWSVKAHLSQDRQVRLTNGKVRRHTEQLEDIAENRKLLKSGWKVVMIAAGAISGFVSFTAMLWQALRAGK